MGLLCKVFGHRNVAYFRKGYPIHSWVRYRTEFCQRCGTQNPDFPYKGDREDNEILEIHFKGTDLLRVQVLGKNGSEEFTGEEVLAMTKHRYEVKGLVLKKKEEPKPYTVPSSTQLYNIWGGFISCHNGKGRWCPKTMENGILKFTTNGFSDDSAKVYMERLKDYVFSTEGNETPISEITFEKFIEVTKIE